MGVKQHFLLRYQGSYYLDTKAYREMANLWKACQRVNRVGMTTPGGSWRRKIERIWRQMTRTGVDCGILYTLKTRNLWQDERVQSTIARHPFKRKKVV